MIHWNKKTGIAYLLFIFIASGVICSCQKSAKLSGENERLLYLIEEDACEVLVKDLSCSISLFENVVLVGENLHDSSLVLIRFSETGEIISVVLKNIRENQVEFN